MGDDLAASNVNRLHSLAATSIAIFTFMLIFLYPRFASDEVNAWLFQVTLVVMGVATFAFVFASLLLLRLLAWRPPDRRCRAGSVLPSRGSLLAARIHPAVPRSELDSLLGRACCRRLYVVRTLAGVRALRDPLLPSRPDVAEELSLAHRRAVLAPMCNVVHPTLPSTSPLSPVCSPARTSCPCSLPATVCADARRIAVAGSSKLAKKPSPALSSSRPRKRARCFRTTA